MVVLRFNEYVCLFMIFIVAWLNSKTFFYQSLEHNWLLNLIVLIIMSNNSLQRLYFDLYYSDMVCKWKVNTLNEFLEVLIWNHTFKTIDLNILKNMSKFIKTLLSWKIKIEKPSFIHCFLNVSLFMLDMNITY